MNAPSVSVPWPPADCSCCILKQTTLYFSELNLTRMRLHTGFIQRRSFTSQFQRMCPVKKALQMKRETKKLQNGRLLQLVWQITDRVALMSKSLEMFALCHLPLVDLGQHFLCNLTVITKEGCTGKTEGIFWTLNPDWMSWPPQASSSLLRKPCCHVFIQCSDTCDSDWRTSLFLSEMVEHVWHGNLGEMFGLL